MKIDKILSQHRRDFTAIYVCEHCDHKKAGGGYDDANFHDNVIPKMVCPECSKTADAESYRALKTKYEEGEVV